MPRVNRVTADPGQFSETQFPDPSHRSWSGPKVHLQHRMICCDCGLAHDFEFIVVKVRRGKGTVRLVGMAPFAYAIQYRARRNERSTAAVRRKKQKRS